MTFPTAGWSAYTWGQGSLWPSGPLTMVPLTMAHDCADTTRDDSRNAGMSRVFQEPIHWLKACATTAIQCGNKDRASSCAMYDLGTNSACSGAL